MNDRILVTYATRTGSTSGIAEAIGQTLSAAGAQVDVRPMSEVQDLNPYRAVVAGSAVQGQKWLPEAMQWMITHYTELKRRPFAAFLVCITLSMKGSEQYRAGVSTWLDPVRALVRPVSDACFAGTLDFEKMPRGFIRVRMYLPVLLGLWKIGDHRDWPAIHAWAGELVHKFAVPVH